MAVEKNIVLRIFKFVEGTDGDQSNLIFTSEIRNSLEFPPEYLEKMVKVLTGHEFDDDDHALANDLHVMGKCAFKFGGDWQYYLNASVNYDK